MELWRYDSSGPCVAADINPFFGTFPTDLTLFGAKMTALAFRRPPPVISTATDSLIASSVQETVTRTASRLASISRTLTAAMTSG
jgi:hypothetical protein